MSINYWDSPKDLPEALDKICVSEQKETATLFDQERVLQDIPYQPDWRVLEIGCGVGRLIRPLRYIFKVVDGIDYSAKMVGLSTEYLQRINGMVLKNNGRTIPFSDSTYDFVFAFTVFQHIRSVEILKSYLNEAYRVLRVGGWFRFQTHEINEQFGRWEEDLDTVWGNAYTKEELEQLVTEAGFVEVKVVEEKPWLWTSATKGGPNGLPISS